MRPRLLALFFFTAAAAAGCAGSDGVPAPAHAGGPPETPAAADPGDPPPLAPPASGEGASPAAPPLPRSLEEFEAEAAPLRCARAIRCGELGASHLARCLADDGSRRRVLLGVARGLQAGRYRFDPEIARACLRVLAEAPCHVDYETTPPGCLAGAVPAGLLPAVAPGGACERWEECVDGICSGEVGCPGTCRPRTPDVGGPCDPNTLCSEHLYCDDGKCVARGDVGATCDGHWQACRPGLVCQGWRPAVDSHHDYRPAQPGTCERRRGLGEPCRRVSLGDDCAAELFCDFGAAAPVCRDRLSEGTACTWLDACADGLRCDGVRLGEHAAANGSGMRALDRPGVCRRVADRGDPCDAAAAQTTCPADGRCENGTCRPRGDTGEPCRERNDCGPYHFCEPRRRECRPQGAPGERCTPGVKGLDGPCFLSECDPTTRRCVAQCRRDK